METRVVKTVFGISNKRLFTIFAFAFALATLLVLCNTSSAFATHTIKSDEKGAPYSYTVHVTAADSTMVNVQIPNMLMDYLDGTQYRARQCRIINDTKYMVYMNCYVRASDNKTAVQWLVGDINGGTTSGWSVNGEGTNTVGLVTGTYLSPGDSMIFDAVNMNADRAMTTTRVSLQFNYKYGGEVKKYQTKKPIVTATKLGSRKVEVNVKFSDKTYQGVTGRTRIVLYQGKKKVKTWTSNAQVPVRVWTGKTKAAVKAKYKVVATTIGNSKDTITSKAVKAKANVLKLAKKPKLKNYSKYSANFVATKLYYKGKKLVVVGYTVNTFGVKQQYPLTAQISIPSKQIAYYSNWQYKYSKGVKKVTLKLKAKKVVNLRAGNVNVQTT